MIPVWRIAKQPVNANATGKRPKQKKHLEPHDL
jgi:hypothetical protein